MDWRQAVMTVIITGTPRQLTGIARGLPNVQVYTERIKLR